MVSTLDRWNGQAAARQMKVGESRGVARLGIVGIAVGLLVSSAALGGVAPTSVLAQWDFNDQTLNASAGVMSATSSLSTIGGVTGNSFATGAGSSDPFQPGLGWQTTGYPAQGTGYASAGIEFRVSTLGHDGVTVRWDLRPSNTASRWSMLLVSADDGWTFFEAGLFESTAGSIWFNGVGADLSGMPVVANRDQVIFRVVSVYGPDGFGYEAAQAGSNYGGGTWRFDTITVEGTAMLVPTPAGLALLALTGVAARRRRRM